MPVKLITTKNEDFSRQYAWLFIIPEQSGRYGHVRLGLLERQVSSEQYQTSSLSQAGRRPQGQT